MKRRYFRKPVIGDPGYVAPKFEPTQTTINPKVDLDSLSNSDLVDLALKLGIDATKVCGMQSCSDHKGMIVCNRAHSNKLRFGIDVLYCLVCFTWWREKEPLPEINETSG